MRLEDLVSELKNMSDEELQANLIELRRKRTIVRPPPEKKSKGKQADPFVELAASLDQMSAEDLQMMLDIMRSGKK